MSGQAVLGVEKARFLYGASKVFEGVSLQLDAARTALVGENGAGKSTLLKCLLGELELDEGQIIKSRGLKIGYVPQDVPPGLSEKTVREVLESALPLADGSEDWKVDVLLDEIGVSYETAQQAFGSLSGGWQRLMLIAAAAKLAEPDLLILDEPTNHLDLSNINTLESWLADDDRLPMLIVSHDREFLERTTTRTIFLRSDGAHSFSVPFSRAREQLLHRDAADAVRRQLEGKEIERLEKVAARYRVWGVKNDAFHKRAKATEKRIDRIETERTESYVARERRLELHDGEIDAKVALRVHGHTVTVPDGSRKLFTIERLNVAAGDRIAILGVNGAGKSMLLNALARAYDPDQEHYDGQAPVRFNPQARLVYFDQKMAELPLRTSLLDYLTAADGATTKDANALLAKAGFPYHRIKGPIADLSHGERARLTFLKMQLAKPNLYLLDEPTNHLDIEGQEALEAQLEASDVACLFVSHDRYFTRAAATRFVEIRRGKLIEVEGPDAFFEAQ
ncbi:MAG: ABC-F family ATP-binding cassette domain-containing protein [Phenylobacterium sp.]|uniref:ABC-F family ATP-binding cassette domain-containing protein n=1 Tax=Phenylobacterium sp. TaxID=1871053 RepID=UPI00272570C0|nr:ABC-F family ATP-binding cassette domain-containing protein [Phenylobacterium sp.]MDO8913128.1 ABC-F family ATP-binding cassette domain-containing protein [Phenylobacterium sp.]MDO9246978.1 ABC-F family ATP-binding cassette domain-containing protein [Phenylobacterium sp.]MDP2011617.1 ABC-F family ATP-binding cassette domain-containing protein [Phenylobacterium sp.]MDP3102468.1 ABC-F family ATP-binding cassette domain-containing protein [Phenylobacterium sp.]